VTPRIHDVLSAALDWIEQEGLVQFDHWDTDLDGQIDAIAFLHSGYAAEWGGVDAYGISTQGRIWSHNSNRLKWRSKGGGGRQISVNQYYISPSVWGRSGSEIGRIGTFLCFSLCHALCCFVVDDDDLK
jgi:hypothetical protein